MEMGCRMGPSCWSFVKAVLTKEFEGKVRTQRPSLLWKKVVCRPSRFRALIAVRSCPWVKAAGGWSAEAERPRKIWFGRGVGFSIAESLMKGNVPYFPTRERAEKRKEKKKQKQKRGG